MAGLIAIVMDDSNERIPDMARQALKMITGQINELQARVAALEMQVLAWHKNNPVSQRLATIPGIGPIIATAIAATVADANVFRNGREFAAWLGLVPRQNSTGGKARLGGISKRGDSYLRRLLVNSAHIVLLCALHVKSSCISGPSTHEAASSPINSVQNPNNRARALDSKKMNGLGFRTKFI